LFGLTNKWVSLAEEAGGREDSEAVTNCYNFFFNLSQAPLTPGPVSHRRCIRDGAVAGFQGGGSNPSLELLVQARGFTIIKIECCSGANHCWG